MDPTIFGLFVITYIAVLIWGIFNHQKTASAILFLVIIALIYDNTILALGHVVGEGDMLEALNKGRFWLHAIFTPTLILFSLFVMREAQIPFFQKTWVLLTFGALTVTAIFVEYFVGLKDLTLKVEKTYGVVSYTSAEEATGPPLMIIIVFAALLIASIALAWKRQWWWMLVGTVAMSLGSAIKLPIESDAFTNAYELVLLITLMLTAIHFSKNAKRASL